MYKLTLLLCLLLLAASCTIEKRIYQPGWHMEWNHRSAQRPDAVTDASLHSPSTAFAPPTNNELRPAPGDSFSTYDSIVTPEQTAVAVVAALPPDSLPKQTTTNDPANRHSVRSQTKRAADQPPLQRKIVVIPSRENANEHLRTDPLVIVMWVLDVLIVAAILLSLFLLLFLGGWEMIFALLICLGLPFFLIVNAVLAIFVKQHRKSPDYQYRDSELVYPIFAAVFVTLGLLLAAFVALIVLIFSGGGF